ncbi:Fpg/Nei family DNA glycosylase [Streptomyces sp. 4N509B]|uniref:Fpg/Nei family DNA glycosylase n=1 Tax=Streptomyces sp. 4N509B TaxID=3457413 RepID=UPI003FCF5BA6
MPEGHTLHRLAAGLRERFGGRRVRADSPQGTFAEGAARLDGRVLVAAEAHGKHLLAVFRAPAAEPCDLTLHVHLGLYGTLRFGDGPAPPPAGQIRLRLVDGEGPVEGPVEHHAGHHAELRGPARCALVTPAERAELHARLGPDPLRPDPDPEPAWRRVATSRVPVAALLLDQKVVAGVGNVYRAEVLFRQGVDPYRTGRELDRATWQALWSDLVTLMAEGVRTGRIDTVRAAHTPEAMGRPPRVDDHGGEVYVYRRAGMPCHVCGERVRTAELRGRNLFWCPGCQR